MVDLNLKYFSRNEINDVSFGCNNGYDDMSIKALLKFDELRDKLGFSLTPTCAFRTVEHDISKGRSGKSQHCLGTAMDFKYKDLAMAIKIVSVAHSVGAMGLAIEKSFVHVDFRNTEKLVTWNY